MAFWDADPIVEDTAKPSKEGEWWKNDPVVDSGESKLPSTLGASEIQGATDQQDLERNFKAPDWLGRSLGRAQDVGKEAFSGILPPEMMQTFFGGSESSLRPEERSEPLISPEVSRQIVGQLPAWAGGNTEFGRGAAESAAGALSSFSSPASLAQLPAFVIPGVAETYALNVLSELPDQGKKLIETANKYGWGSKETGAVATEYGITDLTGFLAGRHGTLGRYADTAQTISKGLKGGEVRKVEGQTVEPTTPQAIPEQLRQAEPIPPQENPAFARFQPESQIPQPEITPPEPIPSRETSSVLLRTEEQPAPPVSREAEKEAAPESVDVSGQNAEPTSTKNAVTDAERKARDIAPAVEAAKRDFGTVWDEAEQVAKADPTAPARLVEEIAAKPRALDDTENALLLRRQIEVQNEHDAAIKAVNDAPGDADAAARLAKARDDLQTTYDAAKSAGTATGRGLNARKMLANKDYSLAKMEAETRAVVNNGKALSERQAADVKALNERIRAAEEKVSAYEARDQFEAALKQAKAGARKTGFKPQSFLEQQAAKARERIIARRGKLFADPIGITQVAHLADEAIIGASHIARGITKFADWSAQMIADFGERIKPHLQALFAKAREIHAQTAKSAVRGPLSDDVRLAMAKKRVATKTEQIEAYLREGTELPKRPALIRPDRELLNLRGELQRAKDEYQKRLEAGRRANMTLPQRAAETFVRAERASKLTGITTLGKLFGAGFTRLITTPIEEGVGAILSKSPFLRRIAAEAPREGGMSLRAEGKALTTGVARGVRDIPTILKGERTNMEALYGKQGYRDPGTILDIPGRVHGAIKSAFKEAERERSTVKRQQFAQRKGIDPTEAATEQEIGQAAHIDAQRAIFMQDNVLSDVFRGGIRMLENSKRFPTAGFYMAKVANFLFPIVKVPTNVALETMTHLGGGVSATGKLIQVMSRGVKNIRPGEADMIMRHYKKGAVGMALFLTGYFNANKFGGFYQKGDKRDPNDVKWGGARIAGINIPPWLLHAPAFIAMQAGATAYRMQHKIYKGEEKGKLAGAMAVAEGLAQEIPFVNEMGRLDKMLADGYEGTKARGDLLRSTVVPQGVQNIANWLERKDSEGNPVHRSPKTELDSLKMGIPGLRDQVPLTMRTGSDKERALSAMTPNEREAFYEKTYMTASPNNKALKRALDPSLPIEQRDALYKEYLEKKAAQSDKAHTTREKHLKEIQAYLENHR